MIVSLVAVTLAGRQRANEERLADEHRREAILAAIGRELRWNRTATRGGLDAGNAHVMVGTLSTVAFQRYGADLATIAPDSVEPVFAHYSIVGKAREGIRTIAGPPGLSADQSVRQQ